MTMAASDTDMAVTTDCFVATDGQATGNGSEASPLTLAALLALYQTYWAGPTIKLRAGTYTGDFDSDLSGNPQGYITIQSYDNEAVVFDGSVFLRGDYTALQGVTIYDSDFLDRGPDNVPIRDGWRSEAGFGKLLHSTIHDTRQGLIVTYQTTQGCEINDLLSYYNGWSGADRGHGHGLYASNAGPAALRIKNVVLWGNFGYGLHCWSESVPAGIEALSNIIIENSVVFCNSLASPTNSNAIIGGSGVGTTVRNPIVRNCVFYERNTGRYCLNLGGLTAGCTGATVEDSLFVGGTFRLKKYDVTEVITGNKFYCTLEADMSAEAYPDNTYGNQPTEGTDIKVLPGDYGRHIVAVFNWAEADTVTVDLTALTDLSAGDSVNCRSALDYTNDNQVLTLDANKCVVVNMQVANRTIATPQGWGAMATTFPKFGCFYVERIP